MEIQIFNKLKEVLLTSQPQLETILLHTGQPLAEEFAAEFNFPAILISFEETNFQRLTNSSQLATCSIAIHVFVPQYQSPGSLMEVGREAHAEYLFNLIDTIHNSINSISKDEFGTPFTRISKVRGDVYDNFTQEYILRYSLTYQS